MADQKISQLTELTNPNSNDIIPIVSGGETKKITVANLAVAGSSGTSGSNGSSGTSGSNGSSGTSGTSGIDGSSGTSGVNGSSGTSGSNGSSGTSGVVSYTGLITTGSVATTQSITGSLNLSGSLNIISGSVTMQDRPAFRVVGAGNAITATTVISGSNYVADYSQGSGWNQSTGLFTAPIAGLYQVNIVARAHSNTEGSAQVIVYKTVGLTNTAQIMVEWATNTTANHIGGSTITKLSVGDILKAVVTVGTISFDGNDNFSVSYIG